MRIILALGCLLTVGCDSFRPQSVYQVVIDPSFTSEQLDAITAGLQVWEQRVGEQIHFTAVIAPCSDADSQTCLVPNHDANVSGSFWLGLTHNNVGGGAYIQLYVNRMPLVVQQNPGETLSHVLKRTTTHELGHAMMGPDHLAPGNLMAASYSDQQDAPTSTDMAHFWSVR